MDDVCKPLIWFIRQVSHEKRSAEALSFLPTVLTYSNLDDMMHTYLCVTALLGHATSLAFSAPSQAPAVNDCAFLRVDPVYPIRTAEIDGYISYEWFAQAAYCPSPPASQANWTCSEFNPLSICRDANDSLGRVVSSRLYQGL